MPKHTKKIMAGAALLLAVALCLTTPAWEEEAQAAPWTQVFRNDYDLDEIHLWLTGGDVTFLDWKQPNNPQGWNTEVQTATYLRGAGPEITAGKGRWQVRFSDKAPFEMQWAEMLDGAVQGAGTLIYDGAWTATEDFDMSPVSIPGSLLLLGSGLLGLVGVAHARGDRAQ